MKILFYCLLLLLSLSSMECDDEEVGSISQFLCVEGIESRFSHLELASNHVRYGIIIQYLTENGWKECEPERVPLLANKNTMNYVIQTFLNTKENREKGVIDSFLRSDTVIVYYEKEVTLLTYELESEGKLQSCDVPGYINTKIIKETFSKDDTISVKLWLKTPEENLENISNQNSLLIDFEHSTCN